MGNYHRQQMKKLLGHPDFAPVLASDVLTGSASNVKSVVGHTVVDSWVAPRDTQLHGLVVQATGALSAGQLDYALVCDGSVAASGSLPAGVQSDARFAGLARQNAVVCASGKLIEIAYAVPSDLGSAQKIRFSVSAEYIGNL